MAKSPKFGGQLTLGLSFWWMFPKFQWRAFSLGNAAFHRDVWIGHHKEIKIHIFLKHVIWLSDSFHDSLKTFDQCSTSAASRRGSFLYSSKHIFKLSFLLLEFFVFGLTFLFLGLERVMFNRQQHRRIEPVAGLRNFSLKLRSGGWWLIVKCVKCCRNFSSTFSWTFIWLSFWQRGKLSFRFYVGGTYFRDHVQDQPPMAFWDFHLQVLKVLLAPVFHCHTR